MTATKNTDDTLIDFITGKTVPNIGVEEIRQEVERFLVEEKGYKKEDIGVDVDIGIEVNGEQYQSKLDLVISISGKMFMIVKCAAGSLESREREVVSAARIFGPFQIPYAVSSNGNNAVIYNTITGKKEAEGLQRILSRQKALLFLENQKPKKISEKRLEKEKIIFRSYDTMNVNVSRKKENLKSSEFKKTNTA